ncbi:MAG TPA: type II CAAX endopeptidase family protein [Thermoguttaceae bacterium]|nr:type II CAAX endopeptidase family protein [Thermoguttaceae bacterium]
MTDCPPRTTRRADALAVLVALVLPLMLVMVYFVILAPYPPALQQTAYALGKIVQFALPVVWVFAVQRSRFAWKKPGLGGLAEALAFGVAIAAAMLVLYHAWLNPAGYLDVAREPVRQRLGGYGLTSLPMYVLFGLFVSLVHSFLEEYYWRWFVFGQLRRLVPLWPAIVISSLGFMLHHVVVLATYFGWFSPATLLFSLAVALGGGVWAWIYHRTGSLYGPWLSHLLVDVAIFVVGYDLVGGCFGP